MDGATPVNSSTAAKIKRKTGIVTLPQNMFLLVGVIISEDALENKGKTSPGHCGADCGHHRRIGVLA
jgi:hypothetical protein